MSQCEGCSQENISIEGWCKWCKVRYIRELEELNEDLRKSVREFSESSCKANKKLDECVALLTEVDGILFRVSWHILRHSKDLRAEEFREEIREFKAKL